MENKVIKNGFVDFLVMFSWTFAIFLIMIFLALYFLAQRPDGSTDGWGELSILPLSPFLLALSAYLASVIHRKFGAKKQVNIDSNKNE